MNSRRDFLSRALHLSLGAAAGVSLLSSLTPGSAKAAENSGGWAGKTPQPDLPGAQRDYITLPPPDVRRGKPLMEALSLRQSHRKFRETELQIRYVGDALWAAFGVNRPDGKRTIPTANDRQNLIIYVSLITGVWRYLPESHELEMAVHFNLCGLFGGAPMTIAYAAQGEYGPMHVGSAYQNVGLYCASVGLANVVKVTGLNVMNQYVQPPADYKILILQSLGWPA